MHSRKYANTDLPYNSEKQALLTPAAHMPQ